MGSSRSLSASFLAVLCLGALAAGTDTALFPTSTASSPDHGSTYVSLQTNLGDDDSGDINDLKTKISADTDNFRSTKKALEANISTQKGLVHDQTSLHNEHQETFQAEKKNLDAKKAERDAKQAQHASLHDASTKAAQEHGDYAQYFFAAMQDRSQRRAKKNSDINFITNSIASLDNIIHWEQSQTARGELLSKKDALNAEKAALDQLDLDEEASLNSLELAKDNAAAALQEATDQLQVLTGEVQDQQGVVSLAETTMKASGQLLNSHISNLKKLQVEYKLVQDHRSKRLKKYQTELDQIHDILDSQSVSGRNALRITPGGWVELPPVNLRTTFTMEGWFYFNPAENDHLALPVVSRAKIFTPEDSKGPDHDKFVFILRLRGGPKEEEKKRTGKYTAYFWNFIMGSRGEPAVAVRLQTDNFMPAGWMHVAVSVSSTTETATIFRDGVAKATHALHGPRWHTSSKGMPIQIGRMKDSLRTYYMDGKVDEFRIFNTFRDHPFEDCDNEPANAINCDMRKTLPGTLTTLRSYYRFDETDGDVIYDASKARLDGKIVNPEFISRAQSNALVGHDTDSEPDTSITSEQVLYTGAGGALALSGTVGNYVDLPGYEGVFGTNGSCEEEGACKAFTIESWFYTDPSQSEYANNLPSISQSTAEGAHLKDHVFTLRMDEGAIPCPESEFRWQFLMGQGQDVCDCEQQYGEDGLPSVGLPDGATCNAAGLQESDAISSNDACMSQCYIIHPERVVDPLILDKDSCLSTCDDPDIDNETNCQSQCVGVNDAGDETVLDDFNSELSCVSSCTDPNVLEEQPCHSSCSDNSIDIAVVGEGQCQPSCSQMYHPGTEPDPANLITEGDCTSRCLIPEVQDDGSTTHTLPDPAIAAGECSAANGVWHARMWINRHVTHREWIPREWQPRTWTKRSWTKRAWKSGYALNLQTDCSSNLVGWQHVAVTVDGHGYSDLYLNGVKEDSDNIRPSMVRLSTDRNIQIGRLHHTSGTEMFHGKIDELRIWQTARSASELAAFQFRKLERATSQRADLIGYYGFDEADNSLEIHDSTCTELSNLSDEGCSASRHGFLHVEIPDDEEPDSISNRAGSAPFDVHNTVTNVQAAGLDHANAPASMGHTWIPAAGLEAKKLHITGTVLASIDNVQTVLPFPHAETDIESHDIPGVHKARWIKGDSLSCHHDIVYSGTIEMAPPPAPVLNDAGEVIEQYDIHQRNAMMLVNTADGFEDIVGGKTALEQAADHQGLVLCYQFGSESNANNMFGIMPFQRFGHITLDVASCNDTIKNADEAGADCGGAHCGVTCTERCSNGQMDGDEEGVDCGGASEECGPCPAP